MNRRISPSASLGWWPERITSVTAIAPALMKGLRGIPFSYSSCTMELKALPEGSRPTRRQRRSPDHAERQGQAEHLRNALDRERRIRIAASRHIAVRIDHAEPEPRGIDARELRNIARNLAPVGSRAHLVGDFADDGLERRHACSRGFRYGLIRELLAPSANLGSSFRAASGRAWQICVQADGGLLFSATWSSSQAGGAALEANAGAFIRFETDGVFGTAGLDSKSVTLPATSFSVAVNLVTSEVVETISGP